jgi:probable phosphoglycerate mutase
MLTLLLVRHGETVYNQAGLMQGWVDSPLTALGREQALNAAGLLADRPLAGLYTSDSGRAVETAAIVAEPHSHLDPVVLADLRELHFGHSEALPSDDVWREVDVKEFFRGILAGDGPGLDGGEGGAAYRSRVGRGFAEVVGRHRDGGEVAIVSHGVTIATYLAMAGWQSPGPVPNASISVVTVSSGGDPAFVTAGQTRPERLFTPVGDIVRE